MNQLAKIETGLVKYDAMCRAIAACRYSDEAASIRGQARALEVLAKQARNIEAERQAAEIRIRAERAWGKLYKQQEKAAGAAAKGTKRNGKQGKLTRSSDTTTLEQLGVTKDQSSTWQKLAEPTDKQFETALNKAAAFGVPTTSGVLKNTGTTIKHDELPDDPHAAVALWVWGRIGQFHDHTKETTPKQCASRCDEVMRQDLKKQLPDLLKWLIKLKGEL